MSDTMFNMSNSEEVVCVFLHHVGKRESAFFFRLVLKIARSQFSRSLHKYRGERKERETERDDLIVDV